MDTYVFIFVHVKYENVLFPPNSCHLCLTRCRPIADRCIIIADRIIMIMRLILHGDRALVFFEDLIQAKSISPRHCGLQVDLSVGSVAASYCQDVSCL